MITSLDIYAARISAGGTTLRTKARRKGAEHMKIGGYPSMGMEHARIVKGAPPAKDGGHTGVRLRQPGWKNSDTVLLSSIDKNTS
jgi:hypothetical protein